MLILCEHKSHRHIDPSIWATLLVVEANALKPREGDLEVLSSWTSPTFKKNSICWAIGISTISRERKHAVESLHFACGIDRRSIGPIVTDYGGPEASLKNIQKRNGVTGEIMAESAVHWV